MVAGFTGFLPHLGHSRSNASSGALPNTPSVPLLIFFLKMLYSTSILGSLQVIVSFSKALGLEQPLSPESKATWRKNDLASPLFPPFF